METEDIGMRKSDRTRAAILSSARDEFAACGYKGTTIRAIAAAVDVDPALVIRYFGSKEQLYNEAIDLQLDLPDLASVPREQMGEHLIRHFLNKWDSEQHREAYMFLFRAAFTNEIAAAHMRTTFCEQIVPHHIALLDDPEEAATRSAAIMTQLFGLGACRYFLRIPTLAEADIEDLVARFAPTIQRYLTGPLHL